MGNTSKATDMAPFPRLSMFHIAMRNTGIFPVAVFPVLLASSGVLEWRIAYVAPHVFPVLLASSALAATVFCTASARPGPRSRRC